MMEVQYVVKQRAFRGRFVLSLLVRLLYVFRFQLDSFLGLACVQSVVLLRRLQWAWALVQILLSESFSALGMGSKFQWIFPLFD